MQIDTYTRQTINAGEIAIIKYSGYENSAITNI